MKRTIAGALLGILLAAGYGRGEEPLWRDARTIARGRADGRTAFMTYDNRDVALANVYEKSKYILPLNGDWKFVFADDFRDMPVQAVASPSLNQEMLNDVRVPGSWELQGYGKADCLNRGYEFAGKAPRPPFIERANPVGAYKTRFDLPLAWFDRDIYLHLGSFGSAAEVYVNGQRVGYAENSGTPAEFRLNDYVVDGTNDLTVAVWKWNTGSWLHGQDAWRLGGLDGDTYIFSQPKTGIWDYRIQAVLDSTEYSKGYMKLDVILSNSFNDEEDVTVYYDLIDPKGQIIKYYFTETTLPANSRDTLHFLAVLPNVRRWSAEDPQLYTVVLRMKKEKRFIEYIPVQVGFRSAEIADGRFLVNGKPTLLKGVVYNRHDPRRGRYVDAETLRRDVELMKQYNINAVRTLYPMPRQFYELCNRYGIYVVDGADLDAGGMGASPVRGGSLTNDPAWQSRYLDRVERLYRADRNYPSVVMWSLGNDPGNGINAQEAYLRLKSLDSLRPVVFKGAFDEWNTDVVFPAYAHGLDIEQLKDDRPLMFSQCSCGDRAVDFSLLDNGRFPGGFLCRWVDEAVRVGDEQEKGYWTYRGDLTEGAPLPDAGGRCEGLVTADRKPQPALEVVRNLYADIVFRVEDPAAGRIEVTNGYQYTNLDRFGFSYKVYSKGRVVRQGTLSLAVNPGASKTVTVPAKPGNSVTFTVTTKYAAPGVPKGTTVLVKRLEL